LGNRQESTVIDTDMQQKQSTRSSYFETSTLQQNSCFCAVELNSDGSFVKAIRKCKLHTDVANADFLNTIYAHARSINLKYGSNPSEEQRALIDTMKRAEWQRIAALDAV
jgi:hypothetical protein